MGLVVWAAIAGSVLGWIAGGYSAIGFWLGGCCGVAMGAWLRMAIRQEIAAAVRSALAADDPDAPPQQPAMPAPEGPPQDAPAARKLRSDPTPEPQHTPAYRYSTPAPNPADALFAKAFAWLLGGNTIVRAGLVVLFLGLVFLARFVALSGLFPIEARLATVAAVGIALLVIGLNKRNERPDFALSLQGAGVAVLYLVVFAAAKVFGVLPPLAGFGFMILFATLGCALAVVQDSRAMAFASFLGGFAVPVLLGGHSDTPLGLFSYMTILNLAILIIAGWKSWRALNLLGFVATFVLASIWGFAAYEDRHYLVCQIFLAISMAIYLATAILYAHNTPGKLGNYADSTLVFGTSLTGFGLQIALVHHRPFASAWSALGFGATYIVLAALTMRQARREMRLLNDCLLAIGVGFVTLAVPLALEVKWTASAWALEGAGAFWIGARQARWMPRAFGLALQGVAAVLVLGSQALNISMIPLANNGFLLPMLVAVPMLHTAWLLRAPLPHSDVVWARGYVSIEYELRQPWFLGGFGFACLALLREVGRRLPTGGVEDFGDPVISLPMQIHVGMIAVLGAMALADWFGEAKDWPVARWPARAGVPLIAVGFLAALLDGRYVVEWPDVAFWAVTAGLAVWLLRRQPVSDWTQAMHIGAVLVITGMVANTVWFGIARGALWHTSWAGVSFLVSATAMLMGLTTWAGKAATAEARGWPLTPYARAYWWYSALMLAALVYGGALASALLAEGVTDPLPYIPVLNPVDLSALLALAALAVWRRMLAGATLRPVLATVLTGRGGLAALAVLGFVLANTIWLRTAHHLLGIGWTIATLAASQIVQSGYSLLWTLIAMGLMLYARARAERLPWLAGAVLLAVVVAKLVLIDMSNVEGLARIVAFIGVGVLMLLIGYVVPLPPRRPDPEIAA
jgi:uncharacterized membrane protein